MCFARSYRETWARLSRTEDAGALEDWAGACLALLDVNAGPACLLAFMQESVRRPGGTPLELASEMGFLAAEICRHAGSRAATSSLQAPHAGAPDRSAPSGDARAGGALCRAWPQSGPGPVMRSLRPSRSRARQPRRDARGGFVAAGPQGWRRPTPRAVWLSSRLRDPLARTTADARRWRPQLRRSRAHAESLCDRALGKAADPAGGRCGGSQAMPLRTRLAAGIVRVPARFPGRAEGSAPFPVQGDRRSRYRASRARTRFVFLSDS